MPISLTKINAAISRLERGDIPEGVSPTAARMYLLEARAAIARAEELYNRAGVTKTESVEWYTPEIFITLARLLMGVIDLDPASCVKAQEIVMAKYFYDEKQNGLLFNWHGRVWNNPPYGGMTKKFLEHGLRQYHRGNMCQGVFLVNRTGAAWYRDICKKFSAKVEVRRRIKFIAIDGKVCGSPRYYNDFLFLGDESQTEKFTTLFGLTSQPEFNQDMSLSELVQIQPTD